MQLNNFQGTLNIKVEGSEIKILGTSSSSHERLTRTYSDCYISEAVEAFIILWENLYED